MPPSPTTDSFVEDEINLRDYWRVLVRRRALILGITAVAAIATAVFTLLQPNIYQSKATLMPLGKSSGGLPAALGDLGALLPPGLGAVAKESPTERIQAILSSRTLAEDVIQRLDLLPRLFAKKWNAEKQQWQTAKPPTLQDGVQALGGLVSVNSEKKMGLIAVTVEHIDLDLAATIVNQYLDTLQRLLNANAFSLAKKNRLFIEARVQQTRQELAAAEEALRQFEQEHKIIALDAQAEAAVKAVATLESLIMAKEVQLAVLQRTVTGASLEVTLLQEELQGLRAQRIKLQQSVPSSRPDSGNNAKTTRAFPSLDDAPEIKLQYIRLRRETEIQNKLFTLLMQQFEQAKIEEARDETAFQILDRAIPSDSDKRVRPKRLQSVILATMLGVFLGVFVAFSQAYLDTTIRTRKQVERQVGMPVLATIPLPVPQRRHRQPSQASSSETVLVLHQPPGTPLAEAYRYLYARLQHLNNGRRIQTVLFTSAGPDDAAPIALANLAIVASSAGEKTLLVDGNVYQPILHRLLHCPLVPGLMDILTDPEGWHKGIQPTTVDNLHLLSAGTVTPTAFPSLESPAFDTLLAQVKNTYTLLLFVAPPVLGLTDAVVLGRKVDATCLVLTCGVSRIEAIVEAKAMLEDTKAHVIGVILTDFSA